MKTRKQTAAQRTSSSEVTARQVRYIKLGRGGRWECECFEKGIIRYGYGSSTRERYPLCRDGHWNALNESFLAQGKDEATATRFTNETKIFFEDRGDVLWITFIGSKFLWGFLTPDNAVRHPDGEGVYRTIQGGWRDTDIKNESLRKENLSGALTKLAAYRGTSCNVDVQDYVLRRINGQKVEAVEVVIGILKDLEAAVHTMIQFLRPDDFEVLVDLIFSTSGWRRLGPVGKAQKTVDMTLHLPSTNEKAFVQVKSRSTNAQLQAYVEQMGAYAYDRMFYVFHSGEAETSDERVVVLGPERIARMAIDAGLCDWLIEKIS